MSPTVSILVAAYNEEASLEKTLNRAITVLRECSPEGELIVLDDCSHDRTPEIIAAFAATNPKETRALRHPVNGGIAKTFEDLYRAATKDFVFLISGDGEYPPEALKLCAPLMDKYDIIVCRRMTKQYTLYRKIISSGYRWSVLLLFGVELYDPGGVKVVKREIYTSVPARSTSVFVEAERLIRAVKRGYKVTRVDIHQEKRVGGKGRGAKFSNVWGALKDLVSMWLEIVILRRI